MTYDNTGYGPLLKLLESELYPYIKFSEKAYRYFIDRYKKKPYLLKSKHRNTYNYLLHNAKNTSFSIRLLSTWAQPIEGYALLRVRLEQLITMSFMFHSKPEDGIVAFNKYLPIAEYNILKANSKSDNLRLALSSILPDFNLDYEKKMAELKNQIETSYNIKDEKFARKWTKLQINQLAEKRDKLVNPDDKISSVKLLDYYNTVYKISNSIIHSDVASTTESFVKIYKNGELRPQEFYVFTNIILLAQFDIIQTYEMSKIFKLDLDEKYLKLFNDYLNKVERDYQLEEA